MSHTMHTLLTISWACAGCRRKSQFQISCKASEEKIAAAVVASHGGLQPRAESERCTRSKCIFRMGTGGSDLHLELVDAAPL